MFANSFILRNSDFIITS